MRRIEDGSPIPDDIDPAVLDAWADALEQLGRPADAAAIRARPAPIPDR